MSSKKIMDSISTNKLWNNKINLLVSFCYAYIGLMSTLYIFRKSFHFLDYLYITCMLILAIRSLFCSVFCPISDWTFIIKPFALLVSLVVSIQLLDLNFMLKNLSAISSMLIMGCIFVKKPNELECLSFIKYIKIGFLLNYVFATIQLFGILVFHKNIFYYLAFYLHIYDSIDYYLVENFRRITGFIWDPYVLGMFCAIGFFVFKSKYIKLWLIILLYFSSSRAGQLGFMMAFIFYYWKNLKKYLKRDNIAIPLFFLLFALMIVNIPSIIKFFNFDRGFSKDSAGWRRVEYITKLPELFRNDNSLLINLFGGAPGYSGARYIISPIDSMAKQYETSLYWGVETDWFGIIVGRGVIGLFLYLCLYVKIFFSNKSRLNKAIAMAIFFGGVGYVYDTAVFACFFAYFAGNSYKVQITRIENKKV